MCQDLSPKKLGNIDERYDYASLISPQVRVRKGDFAVVPTLSISTRNTASRFSNSNNIEVKLGLNVFNGETYELVEKFEDFKTFEKAMLSVGGAKREQRMNKKVLGLWHVGRWAGFEEGLILSLDLIRKFNTLLKA